MKKFKGKKYNGLFYRNISYKKVNANLTDVSEGDVFLNKKGDILIYI